MPTMPPLGCKRLFAVTIPLLFGLASALPAAAQTYKITNLGNVIPEAINDSGSVVGGTGNSAFLYDNGTFTNLGAGYATAINSTGQVVGNYFPRSLTQSAFLYSSGTRSDLNSLVTSGANSVRPIISATGINDSGEITGTVGNANDRMGYAFKQGILSDLYAQDSSPISPTYSDQGTAINNAGQIAGGINDIITGSVNPAVFKDGQITTTFTLNTNLNLGSVATAINSQGDFAGYYDELYNYSAYQGFLYHNGQTEFFGLSDKSADSFNFDDTEVRGINDSDQVVGFSEGEHETSTSPFFTDYNYAYLYENGTMTALNTLIDPSSGWDLTRAYDINNSGEIIGTGTLNGQTRGFLLTPNVAPVPEASSALLFLPALGIFAFVLRKRTAKTVS